MATSNASPDGQAIDVDLPPLHRKNQLQLDGFGINRIPDAGHQADVTDGRLGSDGEVIEHLTVPFRAHCCDSSTNILLVPHLDGIGSAPCLVQTKKLDKFEKR